MSFRKISYSMRGMIWLMAIVCSLVTLFSCSLGHGWYVTIMWIVSLLFLIWAFWASFSAHEPPEK